MRHGGVTVGRPKVKTTSTMVSYPTVYILCICMYICAYVYLYVRIIILRICIILHTIILQ